MDKPATPVKRTTQQAMRMPRQHGGVREGAGRPPRLTFDLLDQIMAALKDGATVDVMCEQVGIALRSFRNWQAYGQTAPPASVLGQLVLRMRALRQAQAAERAIERERRWMRTGVKPTQRRPRGDFFTSQRVQQIVHLAERLREAQRHTRAGNGTAPHNDDPRTGEDTSAPRALTEADANAEEYASFRAAFEAQQAQTRDFLASLATHRPALLDIRERFWGDGSSENRENASTSTDASDELQQGRRVTRKRHGKGHDTLGSSDTRQDDTSW